MVLTAAQVTAFFEDAAQMAIPNATVVQLANEGINTVDDLSEFDKTSIEAIAHNLRRPPAGNPFVFGAKSQKRLIGSGKERKEECKWRTSWTFRLRPSPASKREVAFSSSGRA